MRTEGQATNVDERVAHVEKRAQEGQDMFEAVSYDQNLMRG